MNRTRPSARRRPRRHVPAFAPVPLRAHADGWTPMKLAAFLGALAETGSVCAAARRVGMRRETAYRLRRRPGAGSFVAAWDTAMGRQAPGRRKVTAEELRQHAHCGLLKPLLYRGRHVATARKADNSAVLRLLAPFDRAFRPGGGLGEGGGVSRSVLRQQSASTCPFTPSPPI